MNTRAILKQLNIIEKLVSQTRDLLFCPRGLRITIFKGIVEHWDENYSPNLICYSPNDKEHLIRSLYSIFVNMPLTEIENKEKKKEVLSDIDIDDIPDSIKKVMIETGVSVYNKINENEHQELIKQMEKRYASFYNNKGIK